MTQNDNVIRAEDKLPLAKLIILGVQHTFTMFGATVLVPLLTGMEISVALFMAGICTLLFHVLTKFKMPVFLGSSFAFINPTKMVAYAAAGGGLLGLGIEYAQGGIVVAGLVYLVMAGLVKLFGAKRVISFFPPIVTGPIIIIIGLNLASVAVGQAAGNWLLALLAFAVVAVVSVFTRGFLKMLPVLCGLVVSYIVAMIFGLVNFEPLHEAAWIGLPKFKLAAFDWRAIALIAPVAVATMVEHIGDVIAVGATVGKNFIDEPGLTRTLMGDGIGTSLSAMFGGPANTTYSENTGVLALTGVHKPAVMRVAACFAILLSIVPKLSAIIRTIPEPIIGGISIVLFGMIASIGVRTLVENQINFKLSRNMLISAVILVLGIGGASISFAIGETTFTFAGLALAAIVGIILNKILPEKAGADKTDASKPAADKAAAEQESVQAN